MEIIGRDNARELSLVASCKQQHSHTSRIFGKVMFYSAKYCAHLSRKPYWYATDLRESFSGRHWRRPSITETNWSF